MKTLIILITLLSFLFNAAPCFAKDSKDRATIYNNKWEKEYTVEKYKDKTRVYDKDYKIKYYIKDNKVYNKDWKTQDRVYQKKQNTHKKY
jgi:hypothetical protein